MQVEKRGCDIIVEGSGKDAREEAHWREKREEVEGVREVVEG